MYLVKHKKVSGYSRKYGFQHKEESYKFESVGQLAIFTTAILIGFDIGFSEIQNEEDKYLFTFDYECEEEGSVHENYPVNKDFRSIQDFLNSICEMHRIYQNFEFTETK